MRIAPLRRRAGPRRPVPYPSATQRLDQHVERAVRHCLEAQDARGAWQSLPDARLFDTGLVAYALSHAPDTEAIAAVGRARAWMVDAPPQRHDALARCLDEAPRLVLQRSHREIDLRDSNFYSEVFYRKALLIYALALHAGLNVQSPFGEEEIRNQIGQYYSQCERIQIKQWNKVDLISVYVLLETRKHNRAAVEKAGRYLQTLQAPDGSFCYNPVSTAMAFMALSQACPGSPPWERCRQHLLDAQQPDGTWRFTTSDVWDTTLTLRTFRVHPRFREAALPGAIDFLARTQNPDGGWGFRSLLESDNDTSSCALLALHGLPVDKAISRRGLAYLAPLQTLDGLWRTWQSGGDPPVEDAVAHVVTAFAAYQGLHRVNLEPARAWLVEQYQRQGLWIAGWYRNVPYAVLEVGRALDERHPASQAAAHALLELQNADGGWAGVPGNPSLASATGLALTTLLQTHRIDEPFIMRGLEYLMDHQLEDGSWAGQPELYGPRPLLYHLPTNTHAFASSGLLAAWLQLHPELAPEPGLNPVASARK
jgi:squalene-hopene/tetraprenyl-beta-curcumene cyclase